MTRRVLSLWLPHLATERQRRRWHQQGRGQPAALATTADSAGRPVLAAVDGPAAQAGLSPGLPLAAARARLPELVAVPAAPAAEARTLAALADWGRRFTPWVATDGPDGLLLDVTGCAHLFGGEAALVARVRDGLARLGFTARAGLADNAAAAWGWARFGAARPGAGTDAHEAAVLAAPESRDESLAALLAPLPVAALRLEAATVARLEALGLRGIGDLAALPRAALAARFGDGVGDRLARALGEVDSPITPRRPPPARHTRLAFAEGIADPDTIAAAVARLVDGLCRLLAQGQEGARRLTLRADRVDATPQILRLGTSRPTRSPAHLQRLLAQRRDELAPGYGIEVLELACDEVAPLGADQLALPEAETGRATAPAAGGPASLAALIDRLGNRLGAAAVLQVVSRESFVPEKAQQVVAPLSRGDGAAGAAESAAADSAVPGDSAGDSAPAAPDGAARPLRLLPRPEPVAAVAPVPDAPPASFTWRGTTYRLRRADGPERVLPEWWDPGQADQPPRDYYRVESRQGRRFWLFRSGLYAAEGPPPQWYIHGLFA